MRKRLYFVLPDMPSARGMLDEMLFARIEERHIHFLARRGTLPEDRPEDRPDGSQVFHNPRWGSGLSL